MRDVGRPLIFPLDELPFQLPVLRQVAGLRHPPPESRTV